jgi:hypothetical protein
MVNLTNPMAMKGPVRELIPSPSQRLSVRIPKGKQVKAGRLLVSVAPARYRIVNGAVEVEVPAIELNEAVTNDLL